LNQLVFKISLCFLIFCNTINGIAQITVSETLLSQINLLNTNSSEKEIGQLIDKIKTQGKKDTLIQEALVTLLAENHFIYHNKSSKGIIRIRGYIMAAFKDIMTPESAIPFILSELQNSKSPYMIAAAAKALCGLPNPIEEAATELVYLLDTYLYRDIPSSFDNIQPEWPNSNSTTTVLEILKTLEWYKIHAKWALEPLANFKKMAEQDQLYLTDKVEIQLNKTLYSINNALPTCCQISIKELQLDQIHSYSIYERNECIVADIALEDQTGEIQPFHSFFNQPAIVVFFYTRCDNPNKCSLTISRLAQLQQILQKEKMDQEVRIAAFTYDPFYDNPTQLHQYGTNRGLLFNQQTKAFRSRVKDFEQLKSYFNIQAAYQGEIVSAHTIELYILDHQGQTATAYTRLSWDEEEIIKNLKDLLEESID